MLFVRTFTRSLVLSAAVGFVAFSGTASAELVKRSGSGLCHPPESSYYERTKNYTPYDSLQACLNEGGRLPKGVSAPSGDRVVARAPSSSELAGREYSRSAFGHGWDDADGDCQDYRAEALIASSTTPVRFADNKRCRVVTGRWVSPFTGEVIQNASSIDIDHVYPLAHAWERGASGWSDEKRKKFANDPINLWPAEASLNRSKGARGPVEWLPPAGQCGYVARFVRVGMMYKLTPKPHEAQAYRRMLDNCKATGRVEG